MFPNLNYNERGWWHCNFSLECTLNVQGSRPKEEGIHKVYTGVFSSCLVRGIIYAYEPGAGGLLQPPSIFKWQFSSKRTSNIRTKPLDFRAIIGEIIRVRDLSLQTKLVPYTNEWYCIGKLPHNYLKFVILPKTYSLNKKEWICSLRSEF